jgi:hypothetical protein
MASRGYEILTDKREGMSGWSRSARVGDRDYTVSVQRGKPVRIPYKPRGKNRGWRWNGSVYQQGGGHVWSGRVPGSIGVRGLLIEAGVLQ